MTEPTRNPVTYLSEYELRHLAEHLEKSDRVEELHCLLAQETNEQCNAWYEAKEVAQDTEGYLADVDRAWRLAEEEFTTHHSQVAIGLQCRYALLLGSQSSFMKSVSLDVLTALVREEVWSTHQGLAYAQRIPEAAKRAVALSAIAPFLSESLLGSALAIAQTSGTENERAQAIARLAPYLTASLLRRALRVAQDLEEEEYRTKALIELLPRVAEVGFLEEALAAAREIDDEAERMTALGQMAPHLPEPPLREALDEAQRIRKTRDRGKAIAGFIPRLAELGCPAEALTVVRQVKSEPARAEALARLAPKLPGDLLHEALALARAIRSRPGRVQALTELAACLSGLERERVLREALFAVNEIKSKPMKMQALVKLAPHLTEPLLQVALRKAYDVEHDDKWSRAQEWSKALAELATQLAQRGNAKQAVSVAKAIPHSVVRGQALAGLGPHLSEPLLREVLCQAQDIQSGPGRATALAGLAPYLPRPLIGEALAAARGIQHRMSRLQALTRLALQLPEPEKGQILREAMTGAQAIGDADHRRFALAVMALELAKLDHHNAGLSIAQNIGYKRKWAVQLLGLAEQLAKVGQVQEALSVAWKIEDVRHPVKALASLTPHLPEAIRKDVVRETLSMAQGVKYSWDLPKVLSNLAEQLARAGQVQEALSVARQIRDIRDQVTALARLVPHLPEAIREDIVQEALSVAQGAEHSWDQAKARADLAEQLAKVGQVREALSVGRTLGRESYWRMMLYSLAPQLANVGQVREALSAAREIKDVWRRAEALASLVPYLPKPINEDVVQEALSVAREIDPKERRAPALGRLVLVLAQLPLETLDPLWQETLHVLSRRTRRDLLSDIIVLKPVLTALGGQDAIMEVVRAIQDVGRWWP